METALEEDDTGDGKDRSKLQKENNDRYVAAEGETLVTKGGAESKNEHGDSRYHFESHTHEGNMNADKMDDAEDLECAPGSSSDIRIAIPVKLSRPEIRIDAPDGRAETTVHTPLRKKPTKRRNTCVHFEEPDLKVKIVDNEQDDSMAEKFDLATPTGAHKFGPHGDKMPMTPERETPAYPDPDIAFSSLSAIEKC